MAVRRNSDFPRFSSRTTAERRTVEEPYAQMALKTLRSTTSNRWHKFISRVPATQRQASGVNYPFLEVSEEVQAAVNARTPVVALETTIYTHGRPGRRSINSLHLS